MTTSGLKMRPPSPTLMLIFLARERGRAIRGRRDARCMADDGMQRMRSVGQRYG